jgi:hypothetical protein
MPRVLNGELPINTALLFVAILFPNHEPLPMVVIQLTAKLSVASFSGKAGWNASFVITTEKSTRRKTGARCDSIALRLFGGF